MQLGVSSPINDIKSSYERGQRDEKAAQQGIRHQFRVSGQSSWDTAGQQRC